MRSFFQWCDQLAVSNLIRDSRFLFPIIESIHILALAVLLGMVLIFSLRLLGLAFRQKPLREVYAAISGLRNGALGVMLLTGALLFCSEAMKCYDLPPFRAKMIVLFLAIAFQYAVVGPVANRASRTRTFAGTLAALASLVLWFGVGVAGRAIGFY